jgi:hypothetical protein
MNVLEPIAHGHDSEPTGYTEVSDDDPGDYSTRLEEILDEDLAPTAGLEDHADDEEFVYEGVDAAHVLAPSLGAYRSQLRNILGTEHEDDELEEPKVYEPVRGPEDTALLLVCLYLLFGEFVSLIIVLDRRQCL